jgi:hypothetical protein
MVRIPLVSECYLDGLLLILLSHNDFLKHVNLYLVYPFKQVGESDCDDIERVPREFNETVNRLLDSRVCFDISER